MLVFSLFLSCTLDCNDAVITFQCVVADRQILRLWEMSRRQQKQRSSMFGGMACCGGDQERQGKEVGIGCMVGRQRKSSMTMDVTIGDAVDRCGSSAGCNMYDVG